MKGGSLGNSVKHNAHQTLLQGGGRALESDCLGSNPAPRLLLSDHGQSIIRDLNFLIFKISLDN